jgi:hypothetical protein
MSCRNGVCGLCAETCTVGAQRCASSNEIETCAAPPAGSSCASWGNRRSCPAKHQCSVDRCVKVRRGGTKGTPNHVVKPPDPPRATEVRGRIISLYRYRGLWTLHVEFGDNVNIRPGQLGHVLEGETGKPLRDGGIKILRVSGRYGIATTTLQQVGKNRWVRIEAR